MDDNRFFRFLWRFNAAAIALAVTLVVAGIAWNTIGNFFPPPPPPGAPQGQFTPVPKAAERDYTYRIEGSAQPPAIGDEQLFTLKRWRGEPKVYGLADIRSPMIASPSPASWSDDDTRDVNILAIDGRTAASHWLFHGYQRAILSTDAASDSKPDVPAPAPGATPAVAPVLAMVLQVVDADTNHDGHLDGRDRQSLYYYDGKGGGAVKLLDVDFVLAIGQLDGRRYLVVYEEGPHAIAAIYSVPDFKLLSKAPLPNVSQ